MRNVVNEGKVRCGIPGDIVPGDEGRSVPDAALSGMFLTWRHRRNEAGTVGDVLRCPLQGMRLQIQVLPQEEVADARHEERMW